MHKNTTHNIKSQILLFTILTFLSLSFSANCQSVGVVLSGGGSSGLAHIGVLKALEDNQIPIDYITGTSMGAIIGGLYAAGLSIEEIESFFKSERFKNAIAGKVDEEFVYYYKKKDHDASWITIKANKDTLLNKVLPANVLSPVQLDLEFLESLSGASCISNYSFDSLFIPFRCIATNIEDKEQVIFDSGELSQALRASSTYPFFFRPIYVDGKLLFDGGMYNNFPSDVLYEAFSPDVIIGSNVSSKTNKPDPEDLFSQLENMISSPTNYTLPCDVGVIISPQTNSSTFNFAQPERNINVGYLETMLFMDSIKALVTRRIPKQSVELRRKSFKSKTPEFLINSITLNGENSSFLRYLERIMNKRKDRSSIPFSEMKKRYIRLYNDDKVTYIYPSLKFDKTKGGYDMNIRVHKEKDLALSFGGNFSSRPVNMGFLGVKYNMFGKTPKTLQVKSYFGKFYSSILLDFRFDFQARLPFYLEAEGMLQQWDYFKSFATFFEESKPPFLLQKDEFIGINVGLPIGNKNILTFDNKIGAIINNYYQIENFSLADTSDLTKTEFYTAGVKWSKNTLNHKQFANKGRRIDVSFRTVSALETTVPGSTGVIEEESTEVREWVSLKFLFEDYIWSKKKIKLGYSFESVLSTMPLLSNYKSTILLAPSFQPIPESKTIFQEEFRAHQYGAVGAKFIYSPHNSLDLRVESYMFQPVNRILENDFKQAVYEKSFFRRYYIISTSAVYHSPLGPLSFSVNYYDKRDENFSWILNFGYLIFNNRPLD